MGCASTKEIAHIRQNSRKDSVKVIKVTPGTFVSVSCGTLSQNYTEIGKIGAGAYAEVKLCLYKPLKQNRAVKIIHKAGLHFQQMDPNFMLKEISTLVSLGHPNILRCYEIFEDHFKFYIATEYCKGGELFKKIIEMNHFSETQAAEIMFQLMTAIAYCHSKGVIHRDLKPENILLTDTGNCFDIKVADFGSSCFLDKNRKLTGCFGSAYYVAPEVFKGNYNEKCDIWSCGIILYMMLTGQPPYNGRDSKEILRQLEANPFSVHPEDFPDLSAEVLDLINKMLIIDPNLRISAVESISHPWIQSYKHRKESPELNSLTKLSAFSSSAKLKEAVYIYLASQVVSNAEVNKLKFEFEEIDKNNDGRVSREELLEQYLKTMNEEEAIIAVEAIMKEVDADHSGEIDYAEFLSACLNYKKYLSKSILNVSFQMFDKNHDGVITIDEIKSILGTGKHIDESVWQDFITEVDENQDGVIDIKEFVNLMLSN